MKRLVVGLLLVLLSSALIAQSPFSVPDSASFYTFLDSVDRYYPPDTLEGGDYNHLQRLRMSWGPRLAPDGKMSRANKAILRYADAYNGPQLASSQLHTGIVLPATHQASLDWEELGHTAPLVGGNRAVAKGMGQVHRIAFHPQFGTNNQMIYAGSHYGGLFRSDDGGLNWSMYHTDRGLPMTSIGGVAASDHYVFVCTGNGDHAYDRFGRNALYDPLRGSINNFCPLHTQGVYLASHQASGASDWQAINGTAVGMLTGPTLRSLLEVFEAGGTMRQIVVHPTDDQLLLIATSKGIFRTTNRGYTWQRVLLGPPDGQGGQQTDPQWRGLVFHPTNPDTVYASGTDVFVSGDRGASWTSMTGHQGLRTQTARINLAVTPAAPSYLYAYVIDNAALTSATLHWHNGQHWQAPKTVGSNTPLTRSLGPDWIGIAVCPTNKEVVYVAGLRPRGTHQLTDPASSFTYLFLGDVHDDLHFLGFPPNGDSLLYAGTHGGVSRLRIAPNGTISNFPAWQNLYNGLGISLIWSFDDWLADDGLILTANQDVGINYTKNSGQLWHSDQTLGDGYAVQLDDQTGIFYGKGNDVTRQYVFDPTMVRTDYRGTVDFTLPFDVGYNQSINTVRVPNVFPAQNHPKTDSFYLGFSELFIRKKALLYPNEVPPAYIYDTITSYLLLIDSLGVPIPGSAIPSVCAQASIFVGYDTVQRSANVFEVQESCIMVTATRGPAQINPVAWRKKSNLNTHFYSRWNRRIMEMAFSQDPNTDYTYLVTMGDPWHRRSDLYLQNQAIHCDTCFVRLTQNLPIDNSIPSSTTHDPNPITGIAVDPLNGNRVWVTFSGYSNALKVWYSDDAGLSWQTYDDSTGSLAQLNVPINNIVYQQGTKDRLYIATDVGIYVREGRGPWLRYGENFPNVRVTELKINYCVGKLRAASYGRGVWQTELLPIEEATSYRNFRTISGQETWSADRHLSRDLRIVSGASLHLDSMTLHIPKDGLIVVEPGGVLHVSGSTITNACGQVWQGIQVWGDNSLPQGQGDQGQLILTGSTIEHAREAISPWQVGNFPRPDGTGGSGGVVHAYDSRFINNWRSAGFMQYQMGSQYWSSFTRCTFTFNDQARQRFLGHISAWDIAGLEIKGCTFKDERSQKTGNAYGIYTLEASVHATADRARLSLPRQNNRFEGLSRAIEIGSDARQGSWVVDQSYFEENWRGVVVRANAGVRVLRSDFEVDPYSNQSPFSYGLGLLHQGAFVVEQNAFSYNGSGPNTFASLGIWVDDTKGGYNRLRNNEFEENTFGVYVNGDNGDDGVNFRSGLQIWCNEFLDEAHDFSLFDDPSDPYGASVALDQGSNSEPAKNRFSTPLVPFLGQDWHMNNDGSGMTTINYWMPPNPQPEEIPTDIVNITRRTSSVAGSTNFCADRYTGTIHFRPQVGNNLLSLTDLKQEYYTALQNYQNEKNQGPLNSASIAMNAQIISYWANEVVFWYQNDSAGPHPDSTLAWLGKIPGLLTEYRIVEHYWNQGQYNQVFDHLSSIPTQYSLSAKEQGNHDDYTLLKDILFMAYEDNRNEALLEREEVDMLREIANRNYGTAALQASNIINFFYEHEYTYLPILPEGEATEKLREDIPTVANLAVYPNPSRMWADVVYQLPAGVKEGRLLITAVNGRVMQDISLTQKTGRIALDIQDWLSGIYFVTLMTQDKLERQTTLIIQR